MVSNHARRWLGVPRILTLGALYSSSAKLTLPITPLTEESKVAKACFFLMIWDFSYLVVQNARPEVSTGKKWKSYRSCKRSREYVPAKRGSGTCPARSQRIQVEPDAMVVHVRWERQARLEEIPDMEKEVKMTRVKTTPTECNNCLGQYISS